MYDLTAGGPSAVVASHDRGVASVAFAPDGRALASGSHDRTVQCVDLPSRARKWRLSGFWEQVNSVALSPDGTMIASGSGDLRHAEGKLKTGDRNLGPGAGRLWDARTGRLLHRLGEPSEPVNAVAFSPDSHTLAGGSAARDGSGVVRLWDAPAGSLAWVRNDHPAEVLAVAFAPDGAALASSDAEGQIQLRDVATGAVKRVLKEHVGAVTSVAFAADGKTLVSGGADQRTRLWEVATGQLIREFRADGSLSGMFSGAAERTVTSVVLGPDGATLAACSGSQSPSYGDRRVRIWDTRTGRLMHELQRPESAGRFVALSPDGSTLASSGAGKAIALWDVRTGRLLRELNGHPHPPQSAAFSADGRTLVSGADYRTVKAWDVESGRLLATLVTFFPEGREDSEGDWLALTPDPAYDGSPGVDRFLSWRVGAELCTAGRMAPRLHRPGQLRVVPKPRP
jgi:WD40 repeat protein